MQREKPLYRRSRAADLGGYSLRLMLGWMASLGVLVLLLRMPLSGSSPLVGWTGPRAAERIAVSEVTDPDDPSESETLEDSESPPPTRQFLPSPSGSSESSSEEGGDKAEETAETPDSTEASSDVRHVASLRTVDRRPRIVGGQGILNLHINYPAAAREKGIEGQLEIEFTVDTDGEARNIEVTEPLHPLCDSAAVDAIQAVRFRPGTYEGEPIPIRMTLPVRFQLQPGQQLAPDGAGDAGTEG